MGALVQSDRCCQKRRKLLSLLNMCSGEGQLPSGEYELLQVTEAGKEAEAAGKAVGRAVREGARCMHIINPKVSSEAMRHKALC